MVINYYKKNKQVIVPMVYPLFAMKFYVPLNLPLDLP